jgi:hypothetical protein
MKTWHLACTRMEDYNWAGAIITLIVIFIITEILQRYFRTWEYEDCIMITKDYLANHPDHIFVFGDNKERWGKGGAAKLRDCKNSYGFITKRAPNNNDSSFYKPDEYLSTFAKEMVKLEAKIEAEPEHTFLISKLGAGLANKYHIFEKVIKTGLEYLDRKYDNVILLFDNPFPTKEKDNV